jgi:hypothetical protein
VNVSRISLALKALRELGPRKLGLFALYRLGLKTGYFRWKTEDPSTLLRTGRRRKTDESHPPSSFIRPLLDLPDPAVILKMIGSDGLSQLKAEADEIAGGHVRLFWGQPVPLILTPPGEITHWTDYACGKSAFPNSQSTNFPIPDIKFIWEPARFGWVFTLGRAYHLTDDERYPEAFWRNFEIFQQANPVNMGPNWESAQEVALRLMAFSFAAQVFVDSVHSTADRQSQIAQSIADHATRIPPTLIYARAQNNNHLLSEAAGLITAALALPEHPHADRWSELGWKWFNHGLESQIASDGAYMQHSTNYQRLMLQLALWVLQLQNVTCRMQNEKSANQQISNRATDKLHIATHWLLNLCDPKSGRVPNLGPNDGAYIHPLTILPFSDYRPVLQAAARAFLGKPAFEHGIWDELSYWISSNDGQQELWKLGEEDLTSDNKHLTPKTLHTPKSWAYLRVACFDNRPGHADQLHLDLWWRGLNVAQDAGTYLYNVDPPWDNALTHTAVHNTVMIDNRQQMTPAGRFLYLDRAQAEVLKHKQAEDDSWEQIVASHDGYQRRGMMHIRSVTAYKDDRWVIEDRIQPLADDSQQATHVVRLHWLLPDWEYEMRNAECRVKIKSPYGWISLVVGDQSTITGVQLVRAGEMLHRVGEISPTWGWVSQTYGIKEPALSFAVTAVGELPITLISEWKFPEAG